MICGELPLLAEGSVSEAGWRGLMQDNSCLDAVLHWVTFPALMVLDAALRYAGRGGEPFMLTSFKNASAGRLALTVMCYGRSCMELVL